jgi:hypothetical protein
VLPAPGAFDRIALSHLVIGKLKSFFTERFDMNIKLYLGIFALSVFANGQAKASLYCEGQCDAYWETVSTIYKSGNENTSYSIYDDCRSSNGGTGIPRHTPDCINHGSYTNCTLKCSYPVKRGTSTTAYGDDRSQAANKISENCSSYFSSDREKQNFRLHVAIGACR